jgi:hypothetical protein
MCRSPFRAGRAVAQSVKLEDGDDVYNWPPLDAKSSGIP